jgi:hypothetical protein
MEIKKPKDFLSKQAGINKHVADCYIKAAQKLRMDASGLHNRRVACLAALNDNVGRGCVDIKNSLERVAALDVSATELEELRMAAVLFILYVHEWTRVCAQEKRIDADIKYVFFTHEDKWSFYMMTDDDLDSCRESQRTYSPAPLGYDSDVRLFDRLKDQLAKLLDKSTELEIKARAALEKIWASKDDGAGGYETNCADSGSV